MKLRLFQTYDKWGDESNPVLQYWDEEDQYWYDVIFVRCREELAEESAMTDPDFYE